MMRSIAHRVVLVRHPGTHSRAVHGIEAHVKWARGAVLVLRYVLTGDLVRLRIPLPGPPRRANRLWQHTCFEAFISTTGSLEYHEFNFAPSGEWAAYFFRRYREDALRAEAKVVPMITVHRAEESLEIEIVLDLDGVPGRLSDARLRLGLSAVVEEQGGTFSYWALKHPPGNPDFHHPDAFALEIEPLDRKSLQESVVSNTK